MFTFSFFFPLYFPSMLCFGLIWLGIDDNSTFYTNISTDCTDIGFIKWFIKVSSGQHGHRDTGMWTLHYFFWTVDFHYTLCVIFPSDFQHYRLVRIHGNEAKRKWNKNKQTNKWKEIVAIFLRLKFFILPISH